MLARLKKAKLECPELQKPECIKTHLRDMIILPEMVGCVVGIHNGKVYNQVSILNSFLSIHFINFRLKFALKWLDTIWGNSPLHTSRSNTVVQVLVRLTVPVSFLSSNFYLFIKRINCFVVYKVMLIYDKILNGFYCFHLVIIIWQ